MNAARVLGLSLIVACAASCGSRSPSTTTARGIDTPAVHVGFITEPGCELEAVAEVSYAEHNLQDAVPSCRVTDRRSGAPRGMPCREVGAYLRSTVDPPKGAIIGGGSGPADVAAIEALQNGMNASGFIASSPCWVSTGSGGDH